MRITVLSDDEAFVSALAQAEAPVPGATLHEPDFVAGADASWWQMLVDFGVAAVPVGLAGNLLANWIWQALQKSQDAGVTTLNLSFQRTVKLVIRTAGRQPVEVEVTSDDPEAIRATLVAALSHADQQQ